MRVIIKYVEITNKKQSDWDSVVPNDFNKLAVGNSAKHGSMNSSGEMDDSSSKRKDKMKNMLNEQEMKLIKRKLFNI